MRWVEAAETAYAYYLADMGVDPTADIFGSRALMVWMQDGDQWNKWVDAYGGADKEFTRTMGGTGDGILTHGSRIQANSTEVMRIDGILHQATHMINRKLWKDGNRAWLDEGLAYYYSIKVQETCLHHCVAKKDGNYAKPGKEGGIKDWNDPANWKPLVKEFVVARNDTPLRTVVNKPLTQLDFSATIKAWSVITWLMDTDRTKFLEYFDQMKTNGKNQEAIMQGLWGKGLEELDEEWQAYVKRNY
jgi:hypothetical protein